MEDHVIDCARPKVAAVLAIGTKHEVKRVNVLISRDAGYHSPDPMDNILERGAKSCLALLREYSTSPGSRLGG
ncbi:hypothetical protein J6590_051466 [Homalodisca vitripennis]|nr:hypothetical protein J6590_051466 [Homalodisca vitripennis]